MDMAGRGTNAAIRVVIAVQPLEVIGLRKDVRSSLEALIEKDARALLGVYEEIAKARGLTAKTMLVKGRPAEAILDAARTEGADLIVVGSRGLGGVKGLFLGSVSNAVVQNSKVPVMVVK
jgi:nucleotide-binding universal stress UspA family protein